MGGKRALRPNVRIPGKRKTETGPALSPALAIPAGAPGLSSWLARQSPWKLAAVFHI